MTWQPAPWTAMNGKKEVHHYVSSIEESEEEWWCHLHDALKKVRIVSLCRPNFEFC